MNLSSVLLTALSLLLLLPPPTAVLAALGQSRSRPAASCRSWCAVKSRKRRDTATRAPRTICKAMYKGAEVSQMREGISYCLRTVLDCCWVALRLLAPIRLHPSACTRLGLIAALGYSAALHSGTWLAALQSNPDRDCVEVRLGCFTATHTLPERGSSSSRAFAVSCVCSPSSRLIFLVAVAATNGSSPLLLLTPSPTPSLNGCVSDSCKHMSTRQQQAPPFSRSAVQSRLLHLACCFNQQ